MNWFSETFDWLLFKTHAKIDHFYSHIYHKTSMIYSCCCYSVAKSWPTLCDPMNRSLLGFPVLHHLPEFVQTYAHWVSDTIQPSHSLMYSKMSILTYFTWDLVSLDYPESIGHNNTLTCLLTIFSKISSHIIGLPACKYLGKLSEGWFDRPSQQEGRET